MKKFKERLWLITFLIILGAISSFSLEFIANVTEPTIARNKLLGLKQGVLTVLQIPFTNDTLEETFDKEIITEENEKATVYTSRKDHSIAFELEGPGFMGPLKAVLGLKNDLSTLSGFYVLEQEETPGLGGRISEGWFQKQFSGKHLRPKVLLVKTGKGTSAANEVDAITGATMTSRAVEKLINKGIEKIL